VTARRASLSAAIAVMAAVVAVVPGAGLASAAAASAAQTRVGASRPVMILAVGASRAVSAGEGRGDQLSQPGFVSGACVAAEDAGEDAAEDEAASCGGESFTAGTRVLLASGAAIPISQLKDGDKVEATNTRTGKTQAEAVTAVMLHPDTDRYDLRIRNARGKTAVIDTTARHLFYDLTRHRWTWASRLHHGDKLRTPRGHGSVTVVGGYAPRHRDGWMWDLTIPGNGDHDFYIDTIAGSVLVHNCGEGDPEYSTRTERAGDLQGKYTPGQSTMDPSSQWYHEMLSNEDLLGSINNADEGDGVVVSQEGQILGGNHRMAELLTRVGDGSLDPDEEILIQVLGE
jgi:hypothetical protein